MTTIFAALWLAVVLLTGFSSAGSLLATLAMVPTLWLLAAMGTTTFGAIGVDVLRHSQPADELTAVPLMAAMFWVMMWHGRRRTAANDERVRIVAFEVPPADGGEPAHEYRTYTLWIIPVTVYRVGSVLDVVTPSGDTIASTVLH